VSEIGKMMVGLGLLLLLMGLALIVAGKAHVPIGRLPGDIVYRGKHTTFYFPLASSIVISVVLSLVLYLVARIRH
jgi:hypothetical protein